MGKRIIGIDIARSLAIFGMIIVHFKLVFGDTGSYALKTFANFFDGKAAATFIVIAGIGLSLMTNSAIKNNDFKRIRQNRIRIIKRVIFLFLLGLSYLSIWPGDILHSYAAYMLIALIFLRRKPKDIIFGTLSIVLSFPILLLFFNYETGWDFASVTYQNFWTIKGFLRNLLFNGFNPVFPWVAFMLFGLWLGKQDLHNDTFLKRAFKISVLTFVVIQIISNVSLQLLSSLDAKTFDLIYAFIGTAPMPPTPIFMINGISIATAVISGSIMLSKRYCNNIILIALYRTGTLALTFYVAHVVIGIGFMEELGPKELGTYSIRFSVSYAIAFSTCCIIFALIWTKFYKTGPLEFVMRKLTD